MQKTPHVCDRGDGGVVILIPSLFIFWTALALHYLQAYCFLKRTFKEQRYSLKIKALESLQMLSSRFDGERVTRLGEAFRHITCPEHGSTLWTKTSPQRKLVAQRSAQRPHQHCSGQTATTNTTLFSVYTGNSTAGECLLKQFRVWSDWECGGEPLAQLLPWRRTPAQPGWETLSHLGRLSKRSLNATA